MIVVADTSPVNYLIQINMVELLPQLYGRVVLPQAVLSELQAPGAPIIVRQWSSSLPLWVDVKRAVKTIRLLSVSWTRVNEKLFPSP